MPKLNGLASKLAETWRFGSRKHQERAVSRRAALRSGGRSEVQLGLQLAIFNSLQAKLLSSGTASSQDESRQANISGVWRDIDISAGPFNSLA